MLVKIEDRKDYELHVRTLVNKNLKLGIATKKLVVELAMQSFDDGIVYTQNNLKVQI